MADEIAAAERPTRLPEPTIPLSAMRTFWYSLASLGCGMFFSFNNASISLYLSKFTKNAVTLGLMGSTHSVEGAIIQPVVGMLSDRLRSPRGRRRPFIWIFIPLTALFLVLTPMAEGLSISVRLAVMILLIFLFTVFFNIAFDPYQALMADITPSRQRGRVMSIWALLGLIGQASIVLLPLPLGAKFALVAAVLLITFALTTAFTSEPDPTGLAIERRSHIAELRQAVRGLKTLRQAKIGLVVFFLSGTGIGAVLPYLTLFVKNIAHCTDHEAELMFMVLMISTAITVIPCGWLADRIGTKKMLLISLALTACASLAGLTVETLPQIAVALAVAGVGNAAQSAAALPLLTQLIPNEEVGFYVGLQSMALSIFQPLTVIITGNLINHGSYRAIFAVCAGCVILAFFTLLKVDRAKADQEILVRRAIMEMEARAAGE